MAPSDPHRAPVERVRRRLGSGVAVPERYERVGDVLILPPVARRGDEAAVGEAFAQELGCRSVLVRDGPMEGRVRTPNVRLVWGDEDTQTVVVQHGVRYRFDPRRVMFSAGNLEERARMARTASEGQVVVDLFAGLGYLSLPVAVHASPRMVYACEINPVACSFLEENVGLNEVEERYLPLLGDCRDVAPRGVADRVIMGFLHDTRDYMDVALSALQPGGGTIHYHAKEGLEKWPGRMFADVEGAAQAAGRTARLASWRRVKSYAPRVIHGVLDVAVGPT